MVIVEDEVRCLVTGLSCQFKQEEGLTMPWKQLDQSLIVLVGKKNIGRSWLRPLIKTNNLAMKQPEQPWMEIM